MSLSKRLFEQEQEIELSNQDSLYDAEYMDYIREIETKEETVKEN